jgi:hypothetical protein
MPMASESFSAYHGFVATALAREMNAYFSHSKRMEDYFADRDSRGNPPVYRNQDRSTTEELRLKVIILAATYVEALANLYLSIKLDAEQFAAVDRLELVAKWRSIPSLLLPGYSLPKGGAILGDLKKLVSQRNAVAHMKPRITKSGDVIQEGNLPKKIRIHSQIERWDRLPDTLVENLGKYDGSPEYGKFKVLSSIDDYAAVRRKG